MIVRRTFDVDLIKSVLLDPEINARISEDGTTLDDVVINTEKDCWLEVLDKELIGVVCLEPVNRVCLNIYVQILKRFRRDYSVLAIMDVYKLVLSTNYKKLKVLIPVIYKDVVRFCLRVGMIKEGVDRQSYLKNGSMVDRIMLGITDQEIKRYLGGEYVLD